MHGDEVVGPTVSVYLVALLASLFEKDAEVSIDWLQRPGLVVAVFDGFKGGVAAALSVGAGLCCACRFFTC